MIDKEKILNELVEHIESALNNDSDYVDGIRTDLLQYTVALLKSQPEITHCEDCDLRSHDRAETKFKKTVDIVIHEIVDAQDADPFDAEATTDALSDAEELLKIQDELIKNQNNDIHHMGLIIEEYKKELKNTMYPD